MAENAKAEFDFAPKAHPDSELEESLVATLYEKLLTERERIVGGMRERMNSAIGDTESLADEIDIAQRHTDQAYLMRFADKERKLLMEIDHALEKLKEAEYGVCEGTGEPISPKRLEVRPWTRYSVAHKELLEREKRHHR